MGGDKTRKRGTHRIRQVRGNRRKRERRQKKIAMEGGNEEDWHNVTTGGTVGLYMETFRWGGRRWSY